RRVRDPDNKHVSYSAPGPDEERPFFEPAVDGRLPENEAQFLEYFREIVGLVRGRLTVVNPQYLKVIRAVLENPGRRRKSRSGATAAKRRFPALSTGYTIP